MLIILDLRNDAASVNVRTQQKIVVEIFYSGINGWFDSGNRSIESSILASMDIPIMGTDQYNHQPWYQWIFRLWEPVSTIINSGINGWIDSGNRSMQSSTLASMDIPILGTGQYNHQLWHKWMIRLWEPVNTIINPDINGYSDYGNRSVQSSTLASMDESILGTGQCNHQPWHQWIFRLWEPVNTIINPDINGWFDYGNRSIESSTLASMDIPIMGTGQCNHQPWHQWIFRLWEPANRIINSGINGWFDYGNRSIESSTLASMDIPIMGTGQ